MSDTSETDWEALARMSDDEIDYSDIPPLDAAFFERAELRIPAKQAHAFVQLDPDVLAWFKAKGPTYRAIVNDALRSYIAAK